MTEPSETNPPDHQTPGRGRTWRVVKGLFIAFIAIVLVTGALGVLVGWIAYDHLNRPGVAGPAKPFTVPAGATGQDVARLLEDEGLVQHALFFRAALRLEGGGAAIRQGYYRVPQGLSPMGLLHHLLEGPAAARDPRDLPPELRVTVPEGLTLRQMAELFDDSGAFIEAANDPDLIARLEVETDSLEGFLMPNTYFFDEKPEPRDVLKRMIDQFNSEYTRLIKAHPHAADMDPVEVVTIASLIEREARAAEERPLVSAVIHNRLEQGMTLDLDATLQYALNKYGQRLLNEDKEVESPYNTYRNPGLPPGPIASPGASSLHAAVDPADADYLFFVSNADGRTHTFSRTLSEHNRAVAAFRREIAEQRRQLGEQ